MMVRKLRLQRGWSQEQLAHLSGLNIKTIQRVESGKRAGLETLNSLAAVLEVELDQLRTDNGDELAELPNEEKEVTEYVAGVKDFYAHLFLYIVIMLFITVSQFLSSGGEFKGVLIAAAVWGVGLAIHGLGAFNLLPWFSGAWETKQIEKKLSKKR